MGDFFQQGPVGKSLLQASMNSTDPAGQLFKEFRVMEFTQQERAADDPIHSTRLEPFRSPSMSMTPVLASKLMTWIKPITADCVLSDPKLTAAPIICSDNVTRHAINKFKAIEMAKRIGTPVVAIRLPLSAYTKSAFMASSVRTGHAYQLLLDEHDDLTFYFVPGAPVMCKDNISPSFGLANGTQGVLHSITLNPEKCDVDEVWAEIEGAAPASIVYLNELPLSINVELRNNNANEIDPASTLLPHVQVVPMLLNMRSPRNLKVAKQARLRKLTFYDFGIDLAFALTYYKVQGLTLDRVILDMDTTVMPKINVAAIYVGLSRVRRGDHIRCLPTSNDCRLALNRLEFRTYLINWLNKSSTS